MLLLVFFCNSELYSNDTYIKKKLVAGQTFTIETSGTKYNNTILIPNLEGITVEYAQGSINHDEQNMNGIVGYGKQPVKAFIKANKNVTIDAYVKGTINADEAVSKMIIFTDPTLVLMNKRDERISINGFFPESVNFAVKTESRNKTRIGYSKSIRCMHDFKQILSYTPKAKQKCTIFVSSHDIPINSSQLYASVNGMKQGATFRLGNVSQISEYIPKKKQESCFTNPTNGLRDDEDLVDFENSNNYCYILIKITIISILACIAIILHRKITREWKENKAIPLILTNDDVPTQIECDVQNQQELLSESSDSFSQV